MIAAFSSSFHIFTTALLLPVFKAYSLYCASIIDYLSHYG